MNSRVWAGLCARLRPVVQYKHFTPVQKGHNAIAINFPGSFITGYGGVVAPPFERFYMGGEYDLRGFDIRSVSPVAYLPDRSAITLVNPDGSSVPRDPSNPLRGSYTMPIPVHRIVFPGAISASPTNLEYRFTVFGPVGGTVHGPRGRPDFA